MSSGADSMTQECFRMWPAVMSRGNYGTGWRQKARRAARSSESEGAAVLIKVVN